MVRRRVTNRLLVWGDLEPEPEPNPEPDHMSQHNPPPNRQQQRRIVDTSSISGLSDDQDDEIDLDRSPSSPDIEQGRDMSPSSSTYDKNNQNTMQQLSPGTESVNMAADNSDEHQGYLHNDTPVVAKFDIPSSSEEENQYVQGEADQFEEEEDAGLFDRVGNRIQYRSYD